MREPGVLILFTTAYPFGKGEQFLETELPFLVSRFQRVLVVPTQVRGPMRSLPEGAEVDTSLAARRPGGLAIVAASAKEALTSPAFYRELWEAGHPRTHWRALERAMRYWGDARRTADWLVETLVDRHWPPDQVLAYTYWLGRQTLGVGLARRRAPGLGLVTRAHGSDLYPMAHHPPYLPFRAATLAGADRIFTVSAHGRRYMAQAHPEAQARAEIARLGVRDPGFLTPGSDDGIFRVVSCSFMEPLKRLDRLVAALRELASLQPSWRILWHHLGDGPMRAQLEDAARHLLPGNVGWMFHGLVPNAQVLDFYRQHPVDAFVNVSASEGAPVSIMEALACVIPVVAPAIGGIPELVSGTNGALLPPDPDASTIARALAGLAPGQADPSRRAIARETWHTLARADRNYAAFADRLAELAMGDRLAAS
jgi:glycosyltransferase involved in cell wall biosynthesis